ARLTACASHRRACAPDHRPSPGEHAPAQACPCVCVAPCERRLAHTSPHTTTERVARAGLAGTNLAGNRPAADRKAARMPETDGSGFRAERKGNQPAVGCEASASRFAMRDL